MKNINENESPSPEELAKQLRKPSGEIGKEVAKFMNQGNRLISLEAYKRLVPKKGDHVLEIGMGNGYYVRELLNLAEEISYTGADFSATMVAEANEINKSLIQTGQVRFIEASIVELPFETATFDKITTTNTLYFWPDPLANAKELIRVLKPEGKLLIAYRPKSFMDQLALSEYGFAKYEQEDVEALLREAGFSAISTQIMEEPEFNLDGQLLKMMGMYTCGIKTVSK